MECNPYMHMCPVYWVVAAALYMYMACLKRAKLAQ